ncbi:hypothetical protein [Alkalimarinus alittae]|uniref:Uncharacterized protein n=1 Tax=Alkalimarinus alittae TaxID=2961619 RepID=A0ABY6N1Q5_9ALTE|nr:hypothetical protein [Alkalimarinus alittae]UZE96043.1 hypothetical protein NKI27_18660 [Alkalimarinus alittae]
MSVFTPSTILKSFAIAITLFIASAVHAEQPLTKQAIEKWLSSIDSIQAWSDSVEVLQDDSSDDAEDSFTVDGMLNQLKAANVYDEAEDVVQKGGFDSLEQFADIQIRIVKAMMSLEIDKGYAGGEIQAHLDQIKNNPHISEEQKAMAMNMIQSSIDMAKSMANSSPADKAAIKPYIQQIQQKLNDEEEAM